MAPKAKAKGKGKAVAKANDDDNADFAAHEDGRPRTAREVQFSIDSLMRVRAISYLQSLILT